MKVFGTSCVTEAAFTQEAMALEGSNDPRREQ